LVFICFNFIKRGQKSTDIEKELQKELDTLNSVDKEFNVIDTGAKYTIFIKQSQVDPNQVVDRIFQVGLIEKLPLIIFLLNGNFSST
jgi:hypothetical protein